jgi:hypothetical protein
LFNLRHTVARNVIKRLFTAIRQRFRILLVAPEYDLHVQARIPAALCALHNFIRKHDPDEGPLHKTSDPSDHGYYDSDSYPEATGEEEIDVANEASKRRDEIAQAMWDDYRRYCIEVGIEDGMDFDSEFGDEFDDDDDDDE